MPTRITIYGKYHRAIFILFLILTLYNPHNRHEYVINLSYACFLEHSKTNGLLPTSDSIPNTGQNVVKMNNQHDRHEFSQYCKSVTENMLKVYLYL